MYRSMYNAQRTDGFEPCCRLKLSASVVHRKTEKLPEIQGVPEIPELWLAYANSAVRHPHTQQPGRPPPEQPDRPTRHSPRHISPAHTCPRRTVGWQCCANGLVYDKASAAARLLAASTISWRRRRCSSTPGKAPPTIPASPPGRHQDIVVDTTQLSHVLDRLTNKTIYDKRLRPRYGDKPVDVGITIHVSSISAVSEVDMDFTLDFYMRQTWQDPRLAFGTLDLGMAKQITSLTNAHETYKMQENTGKLKFPLHSVEVVVGVDYLDRLWKPDTFFPNEKKSFFHVATTHNSFLRIDSDGTVFTSQR
ncbi:hypothetical protein ANCCEY_07810 [Ancylostoma ceylanicum]|uniref:Neurotransmitter-gated ion-channel ligand-binding domain-containing protein n=1 Tax=Ancylostoma ceylanicum TaxID=53326 RepID=A0A0D6LPH0_9BILA|nr:hypothetical protein ANCCEY_07810 [Ancylostoma ceylanicum]